MQFHQLNQPRFSGIAIMLAAGFRPFFLLTGLYAVIAPLAWAAIFAHGQPFPTALAPVDWHGHEMIFGFAAAAIGGFLLTAVPNWTGTGPFQGGQLGALVGLWLAGRAGLWLVDLLPLWLVALLDLPFLGLLAFAVGQRIVAVKNDRNYQFIGYIAAFGLGNLLFHAGLLGLADTATAGLYLGFYSALMMMVVVAGRIVPNFTGGALRMKGIEIDVRTDPRVEKGTQLAVLAAMAAHVLLGSGPVFGLAALVAAAFLALRMRHWGSLKTLDSPILWVLHLGHSWLVVGFLVAAASALGAPIVESASLHAFAVGGVGVMVVGVGSRAALGHSGRPLVLPKPIPWVFALVTLGALLRVFGPLVLPMIDYSILIAASAVSWSLGYLVFGIVYWPILTKPRLDGRPG